MSSASSCSIPTAGAVYYQAAPYTYYFSCTPGSKYAYLADVRASYAYTEVRSFCSVSGYNSNITTYTSVGSNPGIGELDLNYSVQSAPQGVWICLDYWRPLAAVPELPVTVIYSGVNNPWYIDLDSICADTATRQSGYNSTVVTSLPAEITVRCRGSEYVLSPSYDSTGSVSVCTELYVDPDHSIPYGHHRSVASVPAFVEFPTASLSGTSGYITGVAGVIASDYVWAAGIITEGAVSRLNAEFIRSNSRFVATRYNTDKQRDIGFFNIMQVYLGTDKIHTFWSPHAPAAICTHPTSGMWGSTYISSSKLDPWTTSVMHDITITQNARPFVEISYQHQSTGQTINKVDTVWTISETFSNGVKVPASNLQLLASAGYVLMSSGSFKAHAIPFNNYILAGSDIYVTDTIRSEYGSIVGVSYFGGNKYSYSAEPLQSLSSPTLFTLGSKLEAVPCKLTLPNYCVNYDQPVLHVSKAYNARSAAVIRLRPGKKDCIDTVALHDTYFGNSSNIFLGIKLQDSNANETASYAVYCINTNQVVATASVILPPQAPCTHYQFTTSLQTHSGVFSASNLQTGKDYDSYRETSGQDSQIGRVSSQDHGSYFSSLVIDAYSDDVTNIDYSTAIGTGGVQRLSSYTVNYSNAYSGTRGDYSSVGGSDVFSSYSSNRSSRHFSGSNITKAVPYYDFLPDIDYRSYPVSLNYASVPGVWVASGELITYPAGLLVDAQLSGSHNTRYGYFKTIEYGHDSFNSDVTVYRSTVSDYPNTFHNYSTNWEQPSVSSRRGFTGSRTSGYEGASEVIEFALSIPLAALPYTGSQTVRAEEDMVSSYRYAQVKVDVGLVRYTCPPDWSRFTSFGEGSTVYVTAFVDSLYSQSGKYYTWRSAASFTSYNAYSHGWGGGSHSHRHYTYAEIECKYHDQILGASVRITGMSSEISTYITTRCNLAQASSFVVSLLSSVPSVPVPAAPTPILLTDHATLRYSYSNNDYRGSVYSVTAAVMSTIGTFVTVQGTGTGHTPARLATICVVT